MKKEIAVAIGLGFVVGLLIVGGLMVAQTAVKNHGQTSQTLSPTPSPSSTASSVTPPQETSAAKTELTISEPADNSVVNTPEINIKGKTVPRARVVIAAEKSEFIIDADEQGFFSQKIELVSGANDVKLVSYSPDLDRTETDLTVVYTTAEF